MGVNRETALKAKLKTATVDVPNWGGTVTIRKLNAVERMEITSRFGDKVEGKKAFELICWVVCRTALDDSGKPLFTDKDLPAIGEMDWDDLQLVSEAAMKLNGLGADVVEEIAKN